MANNNGRRGRRAAAVNAVPSVVSPDKITYGVVFDDGEVVGGTIGAKGNENRRSYPDLKMRPTD